MSALIISLVVLVVLAIAVVVRLLIAELAKPPTPRGKGSQKGAYASARPTAGAAPDPFRAPASAGAPRPASRFEGGTAVLTAPAPNRVRMRDVADKGEGVQIAGSRRVRSALSLTVLVAILGAGAAAVIGAIVLVAGLIFDQAIN